MSRTFRRRNYEATRGRIEGSKIAGLYTEWNTPTWEDAGDYYQRTNSVYRAPTPLEKASRYWLIHGESATRNAWSPSRVHRAPREAELRAFNANELIRFKQREDYEPECRARPTNCWWDWS